MTKTELDGLLKPAIVAKAKELGIEVKKQTKEELIDLILSATPIADVPKKTGVFQRLRGIINK